MQQLPLKDPEEDQDDAPTEPLRPLDSLERLYQQPISVRQRHLGLMALGNEAGSWTD